MKYNEYLKLKEEERKKYYNKFQEWNTHIHNILFCSTCEFDKIKEKNLEFFMKSSFICKKCMWRKIFYKRKKIPVSDISVDSLPF